MAVSFLSFSVIWMSRRKIEQYWIKLVRYSRLYSYELCRRTLS